MAPPPVPMDAYTCLHDPYTVAKTEAYGKQVRVQTQPQPRERVLRGRASLFGAVRRRPPCR